MSQQLLKDWQIDNKNKSAQHKSGLVIQLSNKNAGPSALDILSIEKLVGTPWASRSNRLIEDGISLLASL